VLMALSISSGVMDSPPVQRSPLRHHAGCG
jgi:hypothetical protein